ncbi:MAG: hypothetical protein J0L97_01365 [Alphaproteobacteria bacterium]|nr:hypothetical protein [Alphaproteobacteria bacterium]
MSEDIEDQEKTAVRQAKEEADRAKEQLQRLQGTASASEFSKEQIDALPGSVEEYLRSQKASLSSHEHAKLLAERDVAAFTTGHPPKGVLLTQQECVNSLFRVVLAEEQIEAGTYDKNPVIITYKQPDGSRKPVARVTEAEAEESIKINKACLEKHGKSFEQIRDSEEYQKYKSEKLGSVQEAYKEQQAPKALGDLSVTPAATPLGERPAGTGAAVIVLNQTLRTEFHNMRDMGDEETPTPPLPTPNQPVRERAREGGEADGGGKPAGRKK